MIDLTTLGAGASGERPGAQLHRPEPPRERRPAPTVRASELAYAAREAIRDVLPAEWQTLPDGTSTAAVLAGTLANHYADKQDQQARLIAEAKQEAQP
ncbi:hypothetical protein [Arthrobacter pascens]|uniref:hypothetical protein n=1 Tax=Arthrobacter pascens TaxID=1677 RepID=UPI00196ACC15|nr:hypothetical protein [Arthrobacter pascens]MBN3498600.1 hypothetical protein [Arthrobacter pascens]